VLQYLQDTTINRARKQLHIRRTVSENENVLKKIAEERKKRKIRAGRKGKMQKSSRLALGPNLEPYRQ
jgi:hypothetical protein